jgi:hypothetical protein
LTEVNEYSNIIPQKLVSNNIDFTTIPIRSTAERLVGQDMVTNKPVYMKTLTGNSPTTTDTMTLTGALGVADDVLCWYGTYTTGGATGQRRTIGAGYIGGGLFVRATPSTGTVYLNVATVSDGGGTYQITFLYTKP